MGKIKKNVAKTSGCCLGTISKRLKVQSFICTNNCTKLCLYTTVLQPTVKSLREGDAFCLLQIGEKDSLLYLEVKGGDLQAKENHPSNEAQGVSIMWCGSLAAGGIGASHKIDGIMRQEIYVAILKQYRKTSARKLKACLPSKYTSKRVAKWLKDKKAKVLERPSQNSDVQ